MECGFWKLKTNLVQTSIYRFAFIYYYQFNIISSAWVKLSSLYHILSSYPKEKISFLNWYANFISTKLSCILSYPLAARALRADAHEQPLKTIRELNPATR